MTTLQDRYGIHVNAVITVSHDTADRDYRCGECGSRLVTRYVDGQWLTMCARDSSHEGIVHKAKWAAQQQRELQQQEVAREVMAHLPAELQAAILANQG